MAESLPAPKISAAQFKRFKPISRQTPQKPSPNRRPNSWDAKQRFAPTEDSRSSAVPKAKAPASSLCPSICSGETHRRISEQSKQPDSRGWGWMKNPPTTYSRVSASGSQHRKGRGRRHGDRGHLVSPGNNISEANWSLPSKKTVSFVHSLTRIHFRVFRSPILKNLKSDLASTNKETGGGDWWKKREENWTKNDPSKNGGRSHRKPLLKMAAIAPALEKKNRILLPLCPTNGFHQDVGLLLWRHCIPSRRRSEASKLCASSSHKDGDVRWLLWASLACWPDGSGDLMDFRIRRRSASAERRSIAGANTHARTQPVKHYMAIILNGTFSGRVAELYQSIYRCPKAANGSAGTLPGNHLSAYMFSSWEGLDCLP